MWRSARPALPTHSPGQRTDGDQSLISLAVLVVVIAAGLREWPAVLEGPEPDLTAAAGLAPKLSTRSLRLAHGCLNRAISRAMARDKVKRNVVPLASIPKGLDGRLSKSMTLDEAAALPKAAQGSRLNAYVVTSL